MINKFESGKLYIYKGHRRLDEWNDSGEMDFCLDNKPHKCNKIDIHSPAYASFNDSGSEHVWDWICGFDNWVEVKSWKERFK